MVRRYNQYTPDYKLRVALAASRNDETINQIASEYEVHACQVAEWKKQLLESGAEIFRNRRKSKPKECSEDVELLQRQIGKLTVELDWLKKKQGII